MKATNGFVLKPLLSASLPCPPADATWVDAQIYIFALYTGPKFTQPTFTQNPNLHNPKFTQDPNLHAPRFTPPQIYKTQIYTNPDIHSLKYTQNPNFHSPNITQTPILQHQNLHKKNLHQIIPNISFKGKDILNMYYVLLRTARLMARTDGQPA